LLDGLVRLPHVATDLPPLLRTLIRAAEDRSELQRQADDLSALVDVTGALASGGDPSGCSRTSSIGSPDGSPWSGARWC